MPQLKCPQCARELPAGASACPWDGTPINSVVVRDSLWAGDKTATHDTDDLPALLPGQKLGDYQVLSVLGSGGMGEVYAGEQPMIGKKVAIKVLKAEVAADPANVQRMLSEARAVNAIRHRGIVDIFNFGNLPDGRPYLVMEYLEGTPLDQMLRKQGALIPPEACEFLEEICSALAAAHQRNIVHRDLKPANVYIVSDGNARNRYVKLLDFGLAKGAPSSDAQKQTRAGMVVGTPDYIAPEQARGGTITPRTDLYSLGVMAFEMLTGQLPFTADSVVELMMMHVQAPPPHVKSKIDFCPPALDALIFSMMAKDPADRPRSAEQVRQEIARIRRDLREGETLIGASGSGTPTARETIKIPTPSDTPQAFPQPEVSRPRPSRPPSRPAEVDPTARYAAVPARRSKARLAAFFLPIAVAAATGAWFVLSPARAPPLALPPPPPIAEAPPSPAVVPKAADPEPPLPPVTPKPTGPKPKPAPKPPAGPTEADLELELKALQARRDPKKMSDTLVREIVGRLRAKFNDAPTPEAKRKVLQEIHAQQL